MPLTYGQPFFDETGAKHLVPAEDGALGYGHVVWYDENGDAVDVENVPAESPPIGEASYFDEAGAEWFVPYEVVTATGDGPAVRLNAYVGTRITDRWRMVQLGDHSRIEFELRDDVGALDLTGATTLEVVCRRADKSTLTVAGTSFTPAGETVPNGLAAQFDVGQVNSFGEWLLQAHVVLSGGREFRSAVRRVLVEANV